MNDGPSFYWHDYETFGVDPRRDRPAQFAGQRTNCELEPVGEPLVIYCKPALDVLPRPVSCLITGITPQQADRDGIIEADFAARIHDEFSVAGTCCVGFNSMRFDDEFTRNLLYRNFYDPYAREWENKNSRWDVIDLARMCYALRPQGIEWPMRDVEGRGRLPSFRLEDLTAANNLAHGHAHDALSDVQATIALARLLRSRQPRLFDFYFALRRKQRACELLDYAHRTPVLHVSSRYPAERGCLAMVVPLAQHPTQPNKIIVYDLDVEPTPLLTLDADEIADRVFTPRADLPEGVERIPLKAVSVNRAPALAPLSVLAGVDTARIGLDRERCLAHLELLRDIADLPDKLRHVFATPNDDAVVDPELAIYRGFADDRDRELLRRVRATPPNLLGQSPFTFRDARYAELLFRYRARNWPETLALDERERWEQFRLRRLREHNDLSHSSLDEYLAEIAQLRQVHAADPHKTPLFDALEQWGHHLVQG
jgi:exodeoxyribonuclease-1